MNKFLFLIALMCTLYCCPAYGQDGVDINETVAAKQFEDRLAEVSDTCTMYSTVDGLNIRKAPSEESEILRQTYINTSFEVVLEIGGWSMIITEDGYAYIKSDYLSGEEIPQYTESDLCVLAHVICGEAQSCSNEEQRYVGSVVLNRVEHPEFPHTISEVVFQTGQYACTQDGNYYRTPTEANWANARWLLENGSILPKDVIWQSGRKQGSRVYLKTAYHYYCY